MRGNDLREHIKIMFYMDRVFSDLKKTVNFEGSIDMETLKVHRSVSTESYESQQVRNHYMNYLNG